MANTWEKLHTRWLLAAMAAPLTQAASNCSWTAALTLVALGLGISWGLDRVQAGGTRWKITGAIQWLWMLLVVAEFLHWIMLCWPGYSDYRGAPLILLVLSALSAAKGEENCARTGSVLLWIIAFLLGAVLISGIKEIEWQNLKPQWRMQTAYLSFVMLLPAMGTGMGTAKRNSLLIYGLLVSLVTTGFMSMPLIEKMHAPFYKMSESISFLGVGKRFESLAAVGMTLGYFALVSYLLRVMAKAWEMGKSQRRSVWISAVFCGLVFVSGMRLNSRLLTLGTLVIWVAIPALEIISKKPKFPIDKSHSTW